MSSYPPVEQPPKAFGNGPDDYEKGYVTDDTRIGAEAEQHLGLDKEGHVVYDANAPRALHRKLQNRHMQMIAIGMISNNPRDLAHCIDSS